MVSSSPSGFHAPTETTEHAAIATRKEWTKYMVFKLARNVDELDVRDEKKRA